MLIPDTNSLFLLREVPRRLERALANDALNHRSPPTSEIRMGNNSRQLPRPKCIIIRKKGAEENRSSMSCSDQVPHSNLLASVVAAYIPDSYQLERSTIKQDSKR